MKKRLLTLIFSSSLLSIQALSAEDLPQDTHPAAQILGREGTSPAAKEIKPASQPTVTVANTEQATEAPVANNSSQLNQLIELIENNKFTQAYKLGSKMYHEWEGDEQFDFHYALAAAQTAHYNEAIFPFERLLEAHPNNLRFRLELARCHFFLNNLNAAEREFRQVAASNPPIEVQGHIDGFLARIAEKKQQVSHAFHAGAGLALGYDSNINAAADLDAINATFYQNDSPILTGVLKLDNDEKSQASSYYQLQGYGQYQRPLSKRTSIDASITGSIKDNTIDNTYDLTNIALNGGFRLLRNKHNLRFGGIVRQYWLAGENLQHQILANVAWQWHFARLWKTTTEFEAGQQDNNQNDDLDFSQWQAKGALNRNFEGLNQSIQLGVGSDIAKDSGNDFQGRYYYALSYQAQQLLTTKQRIYGLVNFRANTYADAFADDHIFYAGKTRDDQLMQLIAGWGYEFMTDLATNVQLSHSQNNSNLKLFDYQRTLIEAGLTISFK